MNNTSKPYLIRRLPDGSLPARFSGHWEIVRKSDGTRLAIGEIDSLKICFPELVRDVESYDK